MCRILRSEAITDGSETTWIRNPGMIWCTDLVGSLAVCSTVWPPPGSSLGWGHAPPPYNTQLGQGQGTPQYYMPLIYCSYYSALTLKCPGTELDAPNSMPLIPLMLLTMHYTPLILLVPWQFWCHLTLRYMPLPLLVSLTLLVSLALYSIRCPWYCTVCTLSVQYRIRCPWYLLLPL